MHLEEPLPSESRSTPEQPLPLPSILNPSAGPPPPARGDPPGSCSPTPAWSSCARRSPWPDAAHARRGPSDPPRRRQIRPAAGVGGGRTTAGERGGAGRGGLESGSQRSRACPAVAEAASRRGAGAGQRERRGPEWVVEGHGRKEDSIGLHKKTRVRAVSEGDACWGRVFYDRRAHWRRGIQETRIIYKNFQQTHKRCELTTRVYNNL